MFVHWHEAPARLNRRQRPDYLEKAVVPARSSGMALLNLKRKVEITIVRWNETTYPLKI